MTNTQDSGPGSLRAALVEAAAQPETIISFNLTTSDPGYNATSNDWTIRPATALPALGAGTILNAETQPGTRPAPRVVLDGGLVVETDPPADGLTFTASGASARGLRIFRFAGHGVRLTASTASQNHLRACIVGLDAAGQAAPNALGGVCLDQGAHHNVIGGPTPTDRCVVSGNGGRGLLLTGAGTNANTVSNCFIGTDQSGTAARSNALEGVAILDGASQNLIGTLAAGSGNVISGNAACGVLLFGIGTTEKNLHDNAIGTNAAREAALPNQAGGLAVIGGPDSNMLNLIGGLGGPGNVISGNNGPGLTVRDLEFPSGVSIFGNLIGTDGTGTSAIPNQGPGIAAVNSAGLFAIRLDSRGSGNVISGNHGHGIALFGGGVVIASNYIGLNAAGTAALPNTGSGIHAAGSGSMIGRYTADRPNAIAGMAAMASR